MNFARFRSFAPVFGIGVCTVTAGALCIFLQKSSFKSSIPVYFLILVAIVALRFGSLAGILGTVLAAAIFALFLFEPLGSLAVYNVHERKGLIWLLLFGVALSEICGHAPPTQRRTTRPTLGSDDLQDSASPDIVK